MNTKTILLLHKYFVAAVLHIIIELDMYVPGLLLSLLLYKSLVLGDVIGSKQDHACTLWKYYDNTTNECQCGSKLDNLIRCSKNEDIIGCHCMTIDNISLKSGYCSYSCHYLYNRSTNILHYYEIGTNTTSDLNNDLIIEEV